MDVLKFAVSIITVFCSTYSPTTYMQKQLTYETDTRATDRTSTLFNRTNTLSFVLSIGNEQVFFLKKIIFLLLFLHKRFIHHILTRQKCIYLVNHINEWND